MQLVLPPAGRSLVVAGAALFLVGLLQGAALDLHANPRMALSAHLTAVQSGMAVMIAGILWSATALPGRGETLARWSLAVGMVGLWLGITLAALTGASEVLPMAGEGYSAAPAAETAVSAVVMGSGASLTLGWVLFLWGLIRAR